MYWGGTNSTTTIYFTYFYLSTFSIVISSFVLCSAKSHWLVLELCNIDLSSWWMMRFTWCKTWLYKVIRTSYSAVTRSVLWPFKGCWIWMKMLVCCTSISYKLGRNWNKYLFCSGLSSRRRAILEAEPKKSFTSQRDKKAQMYDPVEGPEITQEEKVAWTENHLELSSKKERIIQPQRQWWNFWKESNISL